MSVFPKTRAAAGYIAGTSPGELARARAAILLARLGACEGILPGDEGGVPGAACGLLRYLVLAVRDLAGPAWMDANGDDPDVAALTVLEAASPPDPARIDEICSRVLWARFAQAPAGTTRATAAPAPASQHPARPLAAALRLKPVNATPQPDCSKYIRPFIAKDHSPSKRGNPGLLR